MIYTEKDSYTFNLNDSYETITQDLSTQTTTFTNIDNQNSFSPLIDNALIILDSFPEDTINDLDTTINENTPNLTCPTGYELKNGVCQKITDTKKDWLKYVLIFAGIFLLIYMYRNYVKN